MKEGRSLSGQSGGPAKQATAPAAAAAAPLTRREGVFVKKVHIDQVIRDAKKVEQTQK